MPHSFAALAVVLVTIAAGAILARALRHLGLSPMIAIAIAGVVVGAVIPQRFDLTLGPGALAAFLPALIFEAAWDADAPTLRRAAKAIAVLAVPGALLTAAIVAGAAVLSGSISWPAAMVLGAVLCATDPVSVLATFRRLGLPHLLVMIVEGESVANDGVALVLVAALIPFAIPGAARMGPLETLVFMLLASAGGVAIGIVLAVAAGYAMRASKSTALRVALTIVVAYGAYAAASALHLSGIFASAAGGVALRALVPLRPDDRDATAIDRTWDGIALAINAVLFALVGLTLQLQTLIEQPFLLLLVIVAVVLARLALAYGLVPLHGLTDDVLRWRHAIALAGLRGGLSLAIVVGLPATLAERESIRDATFAVVFVTLIVQGAILGPLLARLHRSGAADATFGGGAGYSD